MKLGCRLGGPKPAFKFADILHVSDLPPLPATFGFSSIMHGPQKDHSQWGVLANDQLGDCVIAGGMHEIMMWNAIAGRTVHFSNLDAVDEYSAITGFDPSQTDVNGNNPTDSGTDPNDAAKYRRVVGFRDTIARRHKVSAYLDVANGNFTELDYSVWLNGVMGLGFAFPDSAMDQFNAGKPWDYVPGTPDPTDGHYVPILDKVGPEMYRCVTWGKTQLVTRAFIQKYMNIGVCYVDLEWLNAKGLSPGGFDQARLLAMLAEISRA